MRLGHCYYWLGDIGVAWITELEACHRNSNSFSVIGYFGMWKDTMATLAIISVATLLCIAVGIPFGIWMAKSDRVQAALLLF